MTFKNLWGELEEFEEPTTPISHLHAQTTILNGWAKGLLIGEVVSFPYEENQFGADFFIRIPAMSDYRYHLLTVTFPINLYPMTIHNVVADETVTCQSEEEYLSNLKRILQSDDVKRVLAILMALAKEYRDSHPPIWYA